MRRATQTTSFSGILFRQVGLTAHPWSDLYHGLLETSWTTFIVGMGFAFAIVNLAFAGLYMLGGDCVGTGHLLKLNEAFAFSVQTISTVGYGRLSPTIPYANVLVALESFIGLLGVALWSGLSFAKFSRPDAKVAFSQRAVVSQVDGQAMFTIRLANERATSIVDAVADVHAIVRRTTQEGQTLRRFIKLPLVVKRSPVFLMAWQIMHACTDKSPLESLVQGLVDDKLIGVIVTVTGTDDTFKQRVHAQHFYRAEDIMVGYRFEDMLTEEGNTLVVDHSVLHRIVPDPHWISCPCGAACRAAEDE